jgi:meso-butanediol dehydrogenase/(S,S)-butanediol dehydrogenase/diacetyl reductase
MNTADRHGRALIVGGGTGLGLASAQALARAGWQVFLTGRRRAILEDARRTIGPAAVGNEAGDATDEADVDRIVEAAIAALGGLDALVVSAGTTSIGSVETASRDEMIRVLSTNLLPLHLFSKRALRHYSESGGAIVAIASVAGSVPHPARLAYCASKAGQIGMVRQMALDLAERRIRVNAVSPSLVLTDLTRDVIGREADPEAILARRTGQHPLRRLGTPEEVGSAVAYLCSEEASWITGQDFVLDGGLSLAATAAVFAHQR